MGAVVSLPLTAATMVGSWAASCLGAAACSGITQVCGALPSSSIATRIGYAVIFVLNSILSWIMLSGWVVKQLEKLTFDYIKITCHNGDCFGFVYVHRINFALAVFHLVLGLLLMGIRSTKNPRAIIQNSFWGLKIVLWISFIILTFFIPDSFFIFWGNHFAMFFSVIFLFIGLVLLIDFAHSWAELCLQQIEDSDSNIWIFLLVGSTLGMYIGAIVLTTLMYIFFAHGGCSMNQAAITINLILMLIVSGASIHPIVQEFNPQAGLAQSAMVSIYCTYLIVCAVVSEPDDLSCNPLVRSRGTRTASIVIGAIFTFLAIGYTTTTAATKTAAFGNDNGASSGYEPIDSEIHAMRVRAIQSAVDEGSLPASALTDQSLLFSQDDHDEYGDDDGSSNINDDDERVSTKYNYALFHFVFFLATQWIATLLTMNVEKDTLGEFVPVGRTYFSAWVKIVSSWICYALYLWTIVAPALFPERFEV